VTLAATAVFVGATSASVRGRPLGVAQRQHRDQGWPLGVAQRL